MKTRAKILGIEEPATEWELLNIIRRGLPGKTIDILVDILGISISDLGRLLHVSSRTLMRQRGMQLDIHLSDHVLAISTVIAKCEDIFGNEERAVQWLKTPCMALNGESPLNMLDTSVGTSMVMDVLGRIDYGVFA